MNPLPSALPFGILIGALLVLGCGSAGPSQNADVPEESFLLTSDASVDGGTLPIEYTCDGTGQTPGSSPGRTPPRARRSSPC